MSFNVLVLFIVTLVYSTTFPIIRAATANLGGVDICALRFIVAGCCVVPFSLRAARATWRDGIVLGVVGFVACVTQTVGLEYISAGRSAFLSTTSVPMVPLLGLVLGESLNRQALAAALLACAGVGLMFCGGGANWRGDGLTLFCAINYAIYTTWLSQRVGDHSSFDLAVAQIATMAVISLIWLLIAHPHAQALSMLAVRALPVALPLVYLGAVATGGMLYLQAVGQRRVSAAKAAVIGALEPVFAAIFGWWWLHETLGPRGLAGAAMVAGAVVLGEWRFPQKAMSTPDRLRVIPLSGFSQTNQEPRLRGDKWIPPTDPTPKER